MTDRDGSTFIVHYSKNEEEKIDHNENIMIVEGQDETITMIPGTNEKSITKQATIPNNSQKSDMIAEKKMIAAFLNGDNCLTGVSSYLILIKSCEQRYSFYYLGHRLVEV